MDGVTFGTVAAAGVCGGMALYYTVDSVAGHWRRAKVAEFAAALKQQMVEKGYTADDIVRVIAAGPERPAGGADEPDPDLTTALIDGGYDAEHVAAIPAAVDAAPEALRDGIRSAALKMVEGGYDGDDILKFVERRVEASAGTPA